MSIFVVVWHMGGGGQSLIFSEDKYLEHVFTVSDFINFHLLLMAVPTFIFVSIFLYTSKPVSSTTFKKQFIRIFILLTFWPTALIIYNGGYQGLLAILPNSTVGFIYTTLRAGNTIYYFFTSLIICLFISYPFIRLKKHIQIWVFSCSVILLIFLPEFTKLTGFYSLSAYWNPLNFVPISFAAVLVSQNKNHILENKKIALCISIVLCIFLSIFEWKYSVGKVFFPGQGYAIPAYTRASLLFSVFAIFILILNPKIKANGIIKYMAKYSLALYCLHPFLMSQIMGFTAILVQNKIVALYMSILLTIAFSYFMAMLLNKYYLREKVMM